LSSIVESVLANLSGPALQKIAAQLGVSPAAAQGAIAVALPLLVKGLSNNAAAGNGASSLLAALDRNHDGSVLDDVMGFVSGGHESAGGASILSHIFGGNQSAVAGVVGQSAGLDAASSAKLMGILAPLVLGQLGRQKQAAGLDASGLANMLSGEQQSLHERNPSAMEMLSGLLSAAGSGGRASAGQAPNRGPDLMSLGSSLLGQFMKQK
jgi:hypothetical protein